MIRVKVCCISSREELALAVAEGASALGFVASMPSGPGIVTDARVTDFAAHTPPGVSRFLLTSRLDADGIVDHVERTGVDVVQICDHVEPEVLQAVRSRTSARVVAVCHMLHPAVLDYARDSAEVAHALLLDSGTPGADFLELGGTGRTHDWDLSAELVRRSPVPVWLAGGLNCSNVAAAIRKVRPFGVDLCSGVRTDGMLDPVKLAAFMQAVRSVV